MNMLCVPVGPLQANCYLVWDGERRACAVDPGGEPAKLARIIERERLTLQAILVTHGHFDHVEGVKGLAEATAATIYCSALVAPVLAGAQGCSATGWPVPAVGDDGIVVVGEEAPVQVGGLVINVIATPGHTPGDVTYEIGGHLFCGDLVFAGSVGRTDFPGGDFRTLLASVARLARRFPPSTPVHPGHMESTTLGDELATNPFLVGLNTDG
jgi:glyoxylase-like metal-dependent hydrolase (beta-lactamase superfamily II)